MFHLTEVFARDENFNADLLYRHYLFGYKAAIRQVSSDLTGIGVMSPGAVESLSNTSLKLAFSTPTMRSRGALDLHNLAKVDGAGSYICLESGNLYYLTAGFCLGTFVMISGFFAAAGKNIIHASEESRRSMLDGYTYKLDAIKSLTLDQIFEATSEISRPGFFLAALEIGRRKEGGQHIQELINGIDCRYCGVIDAFEKPAGTFDENEDLPAGFRRMPVLVQLRLASPLMDGIVPGDPAAKEQFMAIINKNPGYGLYFWELVRTIAKDHGTYFFPDFSLSEAFSRGRSPAECRRILDEMRGISSED